MNERFAHDHSFPLSNMSDSLISLIFGEQPERPEQPLLIKKEGMSDERMSEFPALAIATHFEVFFFKLTVNKFLCTPRFTQVPVG